MNLKGSCLGLTDVISRRLLEGTEKNHEKSVRISDNPAKIQNENLPNTCAEFHLWNNLFGLWGKDALSCYSFFFLVFKRVGWDWALLVRWPLTGLLHQRRVVDDECGAVGALTIGRGNRSQRKPTPVQLCPPQISPDLTWARTRAVAVGRRRLTAWAMARSVRGFTRILILPKT
jgi:hypothetical protein